MVKELHTVHGSLLLKMDAIEAGLAATGYDLPSEARQSRLLPRLQRQMTELSAKVTASAIGGAAATAAAQQVKQLAAGMAEVRGSSGQVAAAVGALQEALPLVAQQLTGLQAQLQEGMAMSGQSLDTLAKQLHTLQHRDPRPQRPSSPFAGEQPCVVTYCQMSWHPAVPWICAVRWAGVSTPPALPLPPAPHSLLHCLPPPQSPP
jgi:hypothetical protein